MGGVSWVWGGSTECGGGGGLETHLAVPGEVDVDAGHLFEGGHVPGQLGGLLYDLAGHGGRFAVGDGLGSCWRGVAGRGVVGRSHGWRCLQIAARNWVVFNARPKNPWWPEAAALSSFCRGVSSGSGRRQGSDYEVMGRDKGGVQLIDPIRNKNCRFPNELPLQSDQADASDGNDAAWKGVELQLAVTAVIQSTGDSVLDSGGL